MNRRISPDIVRVSGGREVSQDTESFLRENAIGGVIRLLSDDFRQIDTSTKVLTHFNLEWVGHVAGLNYALPLIVRSGHHREGEEEVLPLLSFKGCSIGECLSVRQRIPYELLVAEDFKDSLSSLRNVDDLRRDILKRYRKSLPSKSEGELLAMGVAITRLRIFSTWEEYRV